MKKKLGIIIGILIGIILFIIILYPMVEIERNNKLYVFTYEKENWSEWEQNMCYNESYSYNEKRDISIYGWEYKEFLFFRWFVLEYKDGNVCDTEYLLDEEYIERVIEDAEILDNEDNIDLEELIKDRKAIVGNKRYLGNEYDLGMTYKLDGKHEILYIFYLDDLLVIQVGNSDEGPKFIAYEKE